MSSTCTGVDRVPSGFAMRNTALPGVIRPSVVISNTSSSPASGSRSARKVLLVAVRTTRIL
jgi:hypothetical protein